MEKERRGLSILVVGFFTILLLSATAFGGNINTMFQQLRNSGEDYGIVGTVCEQVARLELYKKFFVKDYVIETGIEYSDGNRVIGELDVVVFRKSDAQAVLVGEVKCWQNLGGAIRKAHDQLKRFLSILRSGRRIYMRTHRRAQYDQRQFQGKFSAISIAQAGSRDAGFDVGLSYTLSELMQLRQELMECQARGQCRRPSH